MAVAQRDAGIQGWEIPRPGVQEEVVEAARSSRRWTKVAAPRAGVAPDPTRALDAADAAHNAARSLITSRADKREIQLRRTFFWRSGEAVTDGHRADDKPVAYRAAPSSVVTYIALLWLASGEGLPPDHKRVRDDPHFLERPEGSKHLPLEDEWGPRFCAHDPHTVRLRANDLGLILGTGPTKKARAEKLRRSMQDLVSEEVRLIRRRASPGPMLDLQLCNDSGSGEPYARIKVGENSKVAPDDQYVPVPVTLFTQGWATVLSPRAFLAYLLILSQKNLQAPYRRLGSTLREKEFPMSDDRFHAGRGELAWWGLVQLSGGSERHDSPVGFGEQEFHRIVYHRPVEGATALRPREVHEALVQAGLAGRPSA